MPKFKFEQDSHQILEKIVKILFKNLFQMSVQLMRMLLGECASIFFKLNLFLFLLIKFQFIVPG